MVTVRKIYIVNVIAGNYIIYIYSSKDIYLFNNVFNFAVLGGGLCSSTEMDID